MLSWFDAVADRKFVFDQMAILLLPVVRFDPAPLPTPTLPTPVVLSRIAFTPIAVLYPPAPNELPAPLP